VLPHSTYKNPKIMNWRKKQKHFLISRKRMRHAIGRSAWLLLLLQCHAVRSAEPAWQGAPMQYVARQARLPDVLKDVASASGLRLDVTRGVNGTVNGEFRQAPVMVFRALIEAWGLVWYFDGQTIHVSTADDVRSRTVGFGPMGRDEVAALLRGLDLDDPHLPLRYSSDSVKIVGPSRFVEAVADAIARAREQSTPQQIFEKTQIRVFPLRYAQAQDISYQSGNRQQTIPGVASLLRQLMENAGASQLAARRNSAHTKWTQGGQRGMPPLPSLPGLGETPPGGSIDESPDELPRSAVTPARRSIVADARTNAVVVYDVPEMMQAYQRAIDMLDRPQDLVEISAVVMDVSSDAARELGVRWGAGGGSGRRAAPYYGSEPSGPSRVHPGVNATVEGALTLTTLIGNSAHFLYQQIHALEQHGQARILSRPRVLTLNNIEATLSSRNSMYVRVAGNQDANLFNVDTGLVLKVTPTIEQSGSENGNVLLSVQIEDGSFDSDASVDGIPRVKSNSIITQAVVGDGESLLIGGYEYERSQTSGSKVPILGDIPFIGQLFGDESTSTDRTERLILITPQLKRVTARRPAPAADPNASPDRAALTGAPAPALPGAAAQPTASLSAPPATPATPATPALAAGIRAGADETASRRSAR
jgi:type III secretion protein C